MAWDRKPSNSEKPFEPGWGDNRELPQLPRTPIKPAIQVEVEGERGPCHFMTRKQMMAERGIRSLKSTGKAAREEPSSPLSADISAKRASTARSYIAGKGSTFSPRGQRMQVPPSPFSKGKREVVQFPDCEKSTHTNDTSPLPSSEAGGWGWGWRAPASVSVLIPTQGPTPFGHPSTMRVNSFVPVLAEAPSAVPPPSLPKPRDVAAPPAAAPSPAKRKSPALRRGEDMEPLLPPGLSSSSAHAAAKPSQAKGSHFAVGTKLAGMRQRQANAEALTPAGNPFAPLPKRPNWLGCCGRFLCLALSCSALTLSGAVVVQSGAMNSWMNGSPSGAKAALLSNGPTVLASLYSQAQQQAPFVLASARGQAEGILLSDPVRGALATGKELTSGALAAAAAAQHRAQDGVMSIGAIHDAVEGTQNITQSIRAKVAGTIASVSQTYDGVMHNPTLLAAMQQEDKITNVMGVFFTSARKTVNDALTSDELHKAIERGQQLAVAAQRTVQEEVGNIVTSDVLTVAVADAQAAAQSAAANGQAAMHAGLSSAQRAAQQAAVDAQQLAQHAAVEAQRAAQEAHDIAVEAISNGAVTSALRQAKSAASDAAGVVKHELEVLNAEEAAPSSKAHAKFEVNEDAHHVV